MTEQIKGWLHKGIFSLTIVAAVAVFGAGGFALAADRPSTAPNPTTKDDCKNGGYAQFQFSNQGQCVSWVEANIHGNGYTGDNGSVLGDSTTVSSTTTTPAVVNGQGGSVLGAATTVADAVTTLPRTGGGIATLLVALVAAIGSLVYLRYRKNLVKK